VVTSSTTASSTSSATRTASPAQVERIEYDPNRTAHIALLLYADGERRYIIAPKGLKAGDELRSGRDAPIKAGNCLPLRNIPVGSTVHCVEMKPGKGAQLARSAGALVQLVAREGSTRRCACVPAKCARCRRLPRHHRRSRQRRAQPAKLGKAGAKRWRGIRPTVRGVAMNPVDHPHGGGEGRTRPGQSAPGVAVGRADQGLQDPHNKRTDRIIVRVAEQVVRGGASCHVHSRRARSSTCT
jgi:large subunit ribosomal protein L2